MKKQIFLFIVMAAASSIFLFSCNTGQTGNKTNSADSLSAVTTKNGGFASQIAWGKHLINMGGCSDCHTPKMMTPKGPGPNMEMYLAGHPANIPPPKVNRSKMESQGLVITNDLTVWIGPWGITYAANLTPDESGIGSWTEGQFIRFFRQGKEKGLKNGRPLLPPMSFVTAEFGHAASDAELKAIYTYLKTLKPVHNVVPAAVLPVHSRK